MDDREYHVNEENFRSASEAGWHVSRYNVQAKVPGKNVVAISNLYKGTCAEYNPIELYVMQSLDEIEENHPLIDRLAKRGVIVNYDEREALEAQSRLGCAMVGGDKVSITICPTLACNFECPYCFANRGKEKMGVEVQDDVVALAGRMIDASRAKKLTVTWFGGEPLLATDVIESLSARLMATAKERGCSYDAYVFTNGYLITPEIVALLERCKVSLIHIPLDGLGATNDATRRLVGGGPTFDRIVENLSLLKPPFQVLIRANTHDGNVAELDDLKELVLSVAKKSGNNNIEFYPAAIIDTTAPDVLDSPMAHYAYDGIEMSLRTDAQFVPVGKDHRCGAQDFWSVTIDDKGYLSKCGGKLCGQPEFAFSTAHEWDPARPFETATNPDMLSRFLNTVDAVIADDKCHDCVWLPICGGGCPQLRLFGKHKCPPYKRDPEAFVLAMHARIGASSQKSA